MNVKNFLKKKTLIIGGIKSGKTHLTSVFVNKILRKSDEKAVVLDFAPTLIRGVGGKMLLPEHPRLEYMTTCIHAPRLQGKNNAEIQELAHGNKKRIEKILDACRSTSAQILIINDVTLYLQSGSCERLVELMSGFPTVLINAYYGNDFEETPISKLEREKVERFMDHFDQVIPMQRRRIVSR